MFNSPPIFKWFVLISWLSMLSLSVSKMKSFKNLIETVKPPNSELIPINNNIQQSSLKTNNDIQLYSLNVHEGNQTVPNRLWKFQRSMGFQHDKLIAIYRWKIWWTIPKLLKGPIGYKGEGNIPPETYLLLGMLEDGSYATFIPSIDSGMGFSLEGSFSEDVKAEDAFIVLHGHRSSHDDYINQPASYQAMVIGNGRDPFLLVQRALREVKEQIRADMMLPSGGCSPAPEVYSRSIRRGKGPPVFTDFLGWCTWDSFYTDLTMDRVLNGLRSFKNHGVTPRFIILDDGWQGTTVNDKSNGNQWFGRLTSFTANFKFAAGYNGGLVENSSGLDSTTIVVEPVHDTRSISGAIGQDIHTNGYSLKDLVDIAKNDLGIKHFLVWHTLTGYWAGVEPNHQTTDMHGYDAELTYGTISPSMSRMSIANVLKNEPFNTEGVGLVHPARVESFFNDYHQALKAMGVDGVKVDAQSVLPTLASSRGNGWDLTKAFHKALKNSVEKNFGRDKDIDHTDSPLSSAHTPVEYPLIHCMCHSQATLLAIAALYTCSDGATSSIPIVRGSDDFWPFDSASHGPHLYANTINSILFSNLGLHDWDMFQSSLGKPSELHAVSRAISGGPVYVSDRPFTQSKAILQKIAFPTGKIPRCIRNALPSPRRIFDDVQRQVGVPLVIQNANSAGGFVIGAFNIVGAVLENDLDNFRFLTAKELIWPETMQLPMEVAGNSTPIHQTDDPMLLEHLGISANVSLMDVSGYIGTNESNGFIAMRFTDKHLFVVDADVDVDEADLSIVPLTLPGIFDCEVISFAQKVYWSSDVGSEHWVVVIGAVDMYNSGGAINNIYPSQAISTDGDSINEGLMLSLSGPGRYWVVYSDVDHEIIPSSEAVLVNVSSLAVKLSHMKIGGDASESSVKVLEFTVDLSCDSEEIVVTLEYESIIS